MELIIADCCSPALQHLGDLEGVGVAGEDVEGAVAVGGDQQPLAPGLGLEEGVGQHLCAPLEQGPDLPQPPRPGVLEEHEVAVHQQGEAVPVSPQIAGGPGELQRLSDRDGVRAVVHLD